MKDILYSVERLKNSPTIELPKRKFEKIFRRIALSSYGLKDNYVPNSLQKIEINIKDWQISFCAADGHGINFDQMNFTESQGSAFNQTRVVVDRRKLYGTIRTLTENTVLLNCVNNLGLMISTPYGDEVSVFASSDFQTESIRSVGGLKKFFEAHMSEYEDSKSRTFIGPLELLQAIKDVNIDSVADTIWLKQDSDKNLVLAQNNNDVTTKVQSFGNGLKEPMRLNIHSMEHFLRIAGSSYLELSWNGPNSFIYFKNKYTDFQRIEMQAPASPGDEKPPKFN